MNISFVVKRKRYDGSKLLSVDLIKGDDAKEFIERHVDLSKATIPVIFSPHSMQNNL